MIHQQLRAAGHRAAVIPVVSLLFFCVILQLHAGRSAKKSANLLHVSGNQKSLATMEKRALVVRLVGGSALIVSPSNEMDNAIELGLKVEAVATLEESGMVELFQLARRLKKKNEATVTWLSNPDATALLSKWAPLSLTGSFGDGAPFLLLFTSVRDSLHLKRLFPKSTVLGIVGIRGTYTMSMKTD